MTDYTFIPTWYTIPEFANRRPQNMYHKENDSCEIAPEPIKNLHVLARAYLKRPDNNQRAILRLSADDSYKLYVNGTFVTLGPAPAYPEHYYYNEIDITPYLKAEENVLAVHLYYQGLVNRVTNSADGRFGVAAWIAADEHGWQDLTWNYQISHAFSGKTIGYETQYLEDFDSNLWDEKWNQPGFDDGDWGQMLPAPFADYTLTLQPTAQLSCYEKEPVKIQKDADGWFVDMGEEITGALLVEAEGEKGSQIVIRCGEELDESGNVRWQLRCNCDYEERWTLNGKRCKLEPYDYKGFRYAKLIPQNGAKLINVRAFVRHYPMDESLCTVKSSDKRLEAIFAICKQAVKCGTQEGYIDCPTREKGQYLGDAIVTANAQVWLTGSTEMLRKCIRQFAQTSAICPGLMGVAPGSFMQEVADFSLLWSQLLLLDYRFTGDRSFLREMYPVAKGILEHFSKYQGEDGLLYQVADKWNLVDWPENLRDNYDFTLSRPVVAPGCHNVVNALFVGAAKTLGEIEAILGMKESMNWEMLANAYIEAFYRKESGLLADSKTSNHSALHSNLYALYFGLLPREKEEKIADFLVEKGFCCGVFASYFMLKGLARVGRFDAVYQLLVNESEHGWMQMVREGASACFEAWGKDQKWNTSLCHPWASAPISVLIECIAGIIPDPTQKDGLRHEPHVPKSLKELRIQVPFRGKSYIFEKPSPNTSLVSKIMTNASSSTS